MKQGIQMSVKSLKLDFTENLHSKFRSNFENQDYAKLRGLH